MNRQMLSSVVAALAVMAGTAGWLVHVQGRQKLGEPGVKTHPIAGSIRLQADLPQRVLDFDSKPLDIDDVTIAVLPKDTSFGQRRYRAPDDFWLDLRVVLMGRDRTSLHKPQFCLTGQGWRIDETVSGDSRLKVDRPVSYELPVVELVAHRAFSVNGQSQVLSGVYVYWYVADDALSASTSGIERMWWMATKLLRTGVLQRWAYVSCFAPCTPGQEAATFERMKQFIVAAVPQFQLYPRAGSGSLTASR